MKPIRNIDVVYTLNSVCKDIDCCYFNCGGDDLKDILYNNPSYDGIKQMAKNAWSIRKLSDMLTLEFKSKHRQNCDFDKIYKLMSDILCIDFGLTIYWKELQQCKKTLSGFTNRLLHEYRMLIQSAHIDDLSKVDLFQPETDKSLHSTKETTD